MNSKKKNLFLCFSINRHELSRVVDVLRCKVNSMSIVSPRNRIICRKYLLGSSRAAAESKIYSRDLMNAFFTVANYNNHQDFKSSTHTTTALVILNSTHDSFYYTQRSNDGERRRNSSTWNLKSFIMCRLDEYYSNMCHNAPQHHVTPKLFITNIKIPN